MSRIKQSGITDVSLCLTDCDKAIHVHKTKTKTEGAEKKKLKSLTYLLLLKNCLRAHTAALHIIQRKPVPLVDLYFDSFYYSLAPIVSIDLSFVYWANRKFCLESYRLSHYSTRSPFLECKNIQQGTPKRCEIKYVESVKYGRNFPLEKMNNHDSLTICDARRSYNRNANRHRATLSHNFRFNSEKYRKRVRYPCLCKCVKIN